MRPLAQVKPLNNLKAAGLPKLLIGKQAGIFVVNVLLVHQIVKLVHDVAHRASPISPTGAPAPNQNQQTPWYSGRRNVRKAKKSRSIKRS